MEFLVISLAIVVLPAALLLWQRADNRDRRQRYIDNAAHEERMEYLRTEALPAQLAIEQEKSARSQADHERNQEHLALERERVQALRALADRMEPPTPREIERTLPPEALATVSAMDDFVSLRGRISATGMTDGTYFYCPRCQMSVSRGMACRCTRY